MEGLPTKDIIDYMNNGNFHIIILGDMMETIVKSLDMLQLLTKYCRHCNVVLLHCGCLSLNPFIKFRIRNNSSSSDVLNIQASISISPKYESQIKDNKSLSFTVA